jgi:hypothetical protein
MAEHKKHTVTYSNAPRVEGPQFPGKKPTAREIAARHDPCDAGRHPYQLHPASDDFGVCSRCGAEKVWDE